MNTVGSAKLLREDATAGALPELAITPTAVQVFMFSAATWNRHHIHYSKDAALAEGLSDIVVQRGLIGNFLGRLLTSWLGDAGEVRELSWKVMQSATPNREVRCQGTIIAQERNGSSRLVTCELKVLNDQGQTIAAGDAKMELS
jgi:hydroxyacyl-ACP dehydratase HTD2-like protein with hotdog domain